jgi:hypothetical protein
MKNFDVEKSLSVISLGLTLLKGGIDLYLKRVQIGKAVEKFMSKKM